MKIPKAKFKKSDLGAEQKTILIYPDDILTCIRRRVERLERETAALREDTADLATIRRRLDELEITKNCSK